MPVNLLNLNVGELALNIIRIYEHMVKVVRCTSQVYFASPYVLLAVVGVKAYAPAQAWEQLLTLPNLGGDILPVIADSILHILNLRRSLVFQVDRTGAIKIALADSGARVGPRAASPADHPRLAVFGATLPYPGAVSGHRGCVSTQSLRSRHP